MFKSNVNVIAISKTGQGKIYRVYQVTNLEADLRRRVRFPVTIVYGPENDTSVTWSLPWQDFIAKFDVIVSLGGYTVETIDKGLDLGIEFDEVDT